MNSLLINNEYRDYDLFSEQISSWDVDFIQLSTGKFQSKLFQYGNADFLITYAGFDQLLYQRGISPQGVWTFAILSHRSSDIIWKNNSVNKNKIIIYSPGSEIDAVSKPGFDVYTLSFSEKSILTVANYLQIDDIITTLSKVKNSVQQTNLLELNILRSEINQFILLLMTSNKNKLPENHDFFSYEILSSILKLLQLTKSDIKRPSIDKRYKAIKKAQEYINDINDDAKITVQNLVDASGVSERTLCYAFKDHFGTSPKAYLKTYRLNQLRKGLYYASKKNYSVEIISKQYGFWHMGQLAKDYYKLFNEKPFDTLRKVY